ncbi:MAG: NERD domain-containing protein [Herminiimonas sp.]|nr:NERD domain-containing protein [Herminiimonas sp.]
MIVKNADNKDSAIAVLESLLLRADVKKQKLITDEIRMMRAGIKAENESAYHIDFHYKDSDKRMVIHDLRLEYGGRVAQIDHLIFNRAHRFFVLETKSFSHGLKINDQGEFLRWNDWKKCFEGMASPIEQNRRHVAVLADVLKELGHKDPFIESFVLISPNARIERPTSSSFPEVVKADQFFAALEKKVVDSTGSVSGFLGAVAKLTFGEAARDIAKKLVSLHRPIIIDYASKFGMTFAASVEQAATVLLPIVAEKKLCATVADVVATGELAAPTASVTKPSSHVCKFCGSDELIIEYGKFGYYFKCGACNGNSPLKVSCGVAGHKERIRKERLVFYRECEGCASSSVFFTNKG